MIDIKWCFEIIPSLLFSNGNDGGGYCSEDAKLFLSHSPSHLATSMNILVQVSKITVSVLH